MEKPKHNNTITVFFFFEKTPLWYYLLDLYIYSLYKQTNVPGRSVGHEIGTTPNINIL